MADLVTHVCTVLLPASLGCRSSAGPLVVGVVLPDVLSRLPGLLLEEAVRLGLGVPDTAVAAWGVLHEPFPLALVCVALSLAFVEAQRVGVLAALLAGVALHLGMDLLQDHHGQGYRLLAPFTAHRVELGLIGSEATVPWALPLAGATAGMWWAGPRVTAVVRRLVRHPSPNDG